MTAENATPRLRWTIASLSAAYALVALALLPVAQTPGPVIPAITTSFGTGVLITDLCTSFLLLVQFRVAPSWSLLLLAVAYFYTGSMAFLHILSFPGAWVPDAVLVEHAANSRVALHLLEPGISGARPHRDPCRGSLQGLSDCRRTCQSRHRHGVRDRLGGHHRAHLGRHGGARLVGTGASRP